MWERGMNAPAQEDLPTPRVSLKHLVRVVASMRVVILSESKRQAGQCWTQTERGEWVADGLQTKGGRKSWVMEECCGRGDCLFLSQFWGARETSLCAKETL